MLAEVWVSLLHPKTNELVAELLAHGYGVKPMAADRSMGMASKYAHLVAIELDHPEIDPGVVIKLMRRFLTKKKISWHAMIANIPSGPAVWDTGRYFEHTTRLAKVDPTPHLDRIQASLDD